MKAISNTRANSREHLKLLLVALTVSFLAACAEPRPTPFPDYHDGYWVTQIEENETGEIVTWINDLHANP